MHDDPVEQLAEAWDRADVLSQQLAAAAQPDGTWSGSDGTGGVTVSVNGTGHVVDITVQRDWRQRVRGDALADAVREAAQAAAQTRLETWGQAFAEQESAPQPRPRAMPLPHESLAYQLDEMTATKRMNSDDGRAALRELLHLLESVERDIDQVSEQVQTYANAMYTGYNLSRDVAVTVSGGGAVVEISYNRHWLVDTGAPNIGRETLTAFRSAYRQADENSTEKVIERSALGEVQALGQDPFGLAQRLHLRD